MLKLVDLTSGYDRRPAVHHVSGEFMAGSLTAIVGPNGGGKSTLLKTIAGLVKPMSGHVEFTKPRLSIGYLPQLVEIDRSFPISVYDVALLGYWPRCGVLRGVSAAQRAQALQALETVGMASFASRPIAALSSGQFQRVLFARLMLQDADLLLLDEPFSAIDMRTAHDLLHLIEDWQRKGKTIMTVLHDMHQVRHHFPQTLMLAREVIGWGPTDQVLVDTNFARAQARAQIWHDHPAECHRDERHAERHP